MVAVKVLVIDPIWKTLSAVVVTPVRVLSTPNGTTVASPPAQTPSTAPGTEVSAASAPSRSVQCRTSIGVSSWSRRRHVVGVGGGS